MWSNEMIRASTNKKPVIAARTICCVLRRLSNRGGSGEHSLSVGSNISLIQHCFTLSHFKTSLAVEFLHLWCCRRESCTRRAQNSVNAGTLLEAIAICSCELSETSCCYVLRLWFFCAHPSKSHDPKSETDDESRHPKSKITDRPRSSKFDQPSTALFGPSLSNSSPPRLPRYWLNRRDLF